MKIKHGSYKDCLLRVPFIPSTNTVKVTDQGRTFYFYCIRGGDFYELSSLYAKALNLDEDRLVTIEGVQPRLLKKVEIEPVDEDSWDVISYNTSFVENNFLAQMRAVQVSSSFPLWVHNICVWLRVVSLDGDWGLLQLDSEILVKPKERKRKVLFKTLRALPGSLYLTTNSFPDNSILACTLNTCLILGICKNGTCPDEHISSNLLQKFSKYKTSQLLLTQDNTLSFLHKFSYEVKISPGEFSANCSKEDLYEISKLYPKLMIFNGMKFEFQDKIITFTLKTNVNQQEWLGFILLTNYGLITCIPPCILAPLQQKILKLPSFIEIAEQISENISQNTLVVVEGAPGVGKSASIVLGIQVLEKRLIAAIKVECRGFSRKDFGNRIIEAVEIAEEKSPAVVVIEDLDMSCAKVEDLQTEEGKLSSSQNALYLLAVLDKYRQSKDMRFVVTCKHRSCLHPLLTTSGYFFCTLAVPALSLPDTSLIFSEYFSSISISSLASYLKSFTVSDIFQFCRLSLLQLQFSEITIESLSHLLKTYTPQALEKKDTTSTTKWSDIGGMFSSKTKIEEAFKFPVKYSDLYSTYPLKLRSGMLLFGPPGCGKTLIASAIPEMCEMTMITVKGPELLNKYIGASEQSVREVFERAKRVKPCAIVFDEFEAIVPKRGSGSTAVTDRIVNQFLCELDGVESRGNVYVIAVSSRPELIDPALLRPGRLDFHVYCGFPDKLERADIFRVMCEKIFLAGDFYKAGEKTNGYTAADIQGVMNNLQIGMAHGKYEGITEELILIEIERCKPSFSKSQIEEYEERFRNFVHKKVQEVGKRLALI